MWVQSLLTESQQLNKTYFLEILWKQLFLLNTNYKLLFFILIQHYSALRLQAVEADTQTSNSPPSEHKQTGNIISSKFSLFS